MIEELCKKLIKEETNDTDDPNFSMILIFYCVSYIFVYLQTNTPNLKVVKTFPGCKKSFNGFPLDKNAGNLDGLSYISCILSTSKRTLCHGHT